MQPWWPSQTDISKHFQKCVYKRTDSNTFVPFHNPFAQKLCKHTCIQTFQTLKLGKRHTEVHHHHPTLVSTHTHARTHTHIHTQACIHAHVHACTHTHAYTHAHAHTHRGNYHITQLAPERIGMTSVRLDSIVSADILCGWTLLKRKEAL